MRISITLIFLANLFLPTSSFSQVFTIAGARQQALNSTVTVRGIVTNGAELGTIRYLQDGTAGIAAFGGNADLNALKPGDSVEITGVLKSYLNLLEFSPVTKITLISSQNPLPAAKKLTIANITEDFESQLIEVNCVNFEEAGMLFDVGNHLIRDTEGGTINARIATAASPLLNTNIPEESVKLTAILSQFQSQYQLLVRDFPDFQLASNCFYISKQPFQTDLSAAGFVVNWQTNLPGFAVLKYGDNPNNLSQEIQATPNGINYTANLTGLTPGKIYWTQAIATKGLEKSTSDVVPFATVSSSSGQILVFFNHDVDLSTGGGGIAPVGQTPTEILNAILDKINNAEKTIDVALYNNDRSQITNALKAAQTRGVRVRYVAAFKASSPALDPPPNFPVIYGNEFNLMHNKFMVVDADSPDKSWVLSGSMNWTNQNINQDFNNSLFIQDQSLARTYQIEFEEMWGNSGDQPDTINAKFGSGKTDNTPHRFIIGGVPVESYFSPSDQTNTQIRRVLESADDNLQFSLLVFTKNDLGDAVVARHAAGVSCRGIIDNWNDSGSEFQHLINNGVGVISDQPAPIVHHKYVVVDALKPDSDPTVETGSHNWSVSAETVNDENTLILHDETIAVLYLQEFNKRYVDLNTATQSSENLQVSIFPNPARTTLTFDFLEKNEGQKRVEIWDATGKKFDTQHFPAGAKPLVRVADLPDGFYFLKIFTRDGFAAVSFQKI